MKFKPRRLTGKRYHVKGHLKMTSKGTYARTSGYTGSNPSVTNITKDISHPSIKRTTTYDKQGRVTKTTDKSALSRRQKAKIANQALNIEKWRQVGSMSRVANIADSSARAAEAAAKLVAPQVTGREDASTRTTSEDPEADHTLRDDVAETAGNLWNLLGD